MKPGGVSCTDLPEMIRVLCLERQVPTPRETLDMRWHISACPECHARTSLIHSNDIPYCPMLCLLPIALYRTERLDPPDEAAAQRVVAGMSLVEARKILKHADSGCSMCALWRPRLEWEEEPEPAAVLKSLREIDAEGAKHAERMEKVLGFRWPTTSWGWTTLSEVATASYGISVGWRSVSMTEHLSEDAIRFVQVGDVGVGVLIAPQFLQAPRRLGKDLQAVQAGDVLMARIHPTGTRVQPDRGEGHITISDIGVLRPDPRLVDVGYLVRVIGSDGFRREWERRLSSRRSRLPRWKLAGIRFPLPPLSEQREIVAGFTALDALRSTRQRAIDTLAQMERSVFGEFFGVS